MPKLLLVYDSCTDVRKSQPKKRSHIRSSIHRQSTGKMAVGAVIREALYFKTGKEIDVIHVYLDTNNLLATSERTVISIRTRNNDNQHSIAEKT